MTRGQARSGPRPSSAWNAGMPAAIAILMACTGSQPRGTEPDTTSFVDVEVPLAMDLYSHLAPAAVWGNPYLPNISAAILVDGDQATLVQVAPAISRALLEPGGIEIPALLTTEKGNPVVPTTQAHLVEMIQYTARHPNGLRYPIVPLVVIPEADSDMETVWSLLLGSNGYNPDAPVLVAWEDRGSRVAVADIWTTRSTEGSAAILIQDEFFAKAWHAAHDIVIIGPESAIECRAPKEGLGPCEQVAQRSKLTRIGLCGFRTWSEALAAMETRVSRVTEIALFQDCSFLERQVAEEVR